MTERLTHSFYGLRLKKKKICVGVEDLSSKEVFILSSKNKILMWISERTSQLGKIDR